MVFGGPWCTNFNLPYWSAFTGENVWYWKYWASLRGYRTFSLTQHFPDCDEKKSRLHHNGGALFPITQADWVYQLEEFSSSEWTTYPVWFSASAAISTICFEGNIWQNKPGTEWISLIYITKSLSLCCCYTHLTWCNHQHFEFQTEKFARSLRPTPHSLAPFPSPPVLKFPKIDCHRSPSRQQPRK